MSYKIRRLKSQIKVCTGAEDNKSWQLKDEVDMLNDMLNSEMET
jgi:hypothetical protein